MRPWTVNAQRNHHHMKTAKLVKMWRAHARAAAHQWEPADGQVDIVAETWLTGRRSQDCGAMYPAVKAIIDGIVDAGILPDDTPAYVRSIKMYAPEFCAGRDLVRVTLWHAT